MYRDTATALDEHDRAVGAILIGEALVDECERAAVKVRRPDTATEQERWRAVEEVNDTYPEVWRHLDRARGVLAKRGANTVGYDELRPHVRRAATDADGQRVDGDALDEAKRAIAELKLAVPGADWKGIATRTEGLVHAPLGARRRQARYVAAGVVAVAVFAAIAWFMSIVPVRKPSHTEAMRKELAGVANERRARVDFLRAELGDRCLTPTARDLVRLLVMDGRGPEAKDLAADYTSRCGDDESIAHWANAPKPGR